MFVPPEDARRLVVIADSLAFCDAKGPQLPDHPALYPNRAAAALSNATGQRWASSVIARAGADVRDAWRWVSKDRHVKFESVAAADAIIVAIGSFDHAPMGVPRWMEVLGGYMHPTGLRRTYRRGLHAVYPWIASATRGRFARTPPTEFDRLYRLLLRQVIGLTQASAPIVAMGPTDHRSAYYGGAHPHRESRCLAQAKIAAELGVELVDPWPLVEPHADALNPDGIHWPDPAHAAVAGALAAALIEQLRGGSQLPPLPN